MSDVREFGAIGDGKMDDTEALQHAIDDGNGLLEFGRGNYRISKPLLFNLDKRGRTAISGSGGVAKIQMYGAGPALNFQATHASTADPAGFRPEEWENERMPTIDGIEIEGHHPKADGILIQGVMQPTLTRVLIRQVQTAVRVTDRARNLLINGCHFYHNTGVGVHLDNVNLHQSIIADSHISYNRLGGIRIEGSEIRNLQITGNDIEYNNNAKFGKEFPDGDAEPTAEIFIDVREGTVREGTISSNTIQATFSSNGSNIRFIGQGPEKAQKAGMWTITGNLIGSQRNNIHLTSARGFTISGNYIYSGHYRNVLVEDSRNIVLGDNTIGHNPDYGIKELATGVRFVDSENIVMNGVLIQDAAAGKHTVSNAGALERDALVELVRCKCVTMTGCQILDGTPTGLLLDNCQDTMVANCTIMDRREESKTETGVLWKGNAGGNMFNNNRVSGAKKNVEAPESVTQSGNVTT
jgi:hypothetical protein